MGNSSHAPHQARSSQYWRSVRHAPVILVLALAAGLLLTSLDRDRLWEDEGDTAVLARSILRFGVPTAWDGVTFSDSDFGTRLNDKLVMVSHPWLQYYVTAASFALIGDSTRAARLPFALAGLATIGLVYVMVVTIARNQGAALAAVILMTSSVQFLIYARQDRHYVLTAALACLLIFQFVRLSSWPSALRFAAIAVLLFHSHPMGLAPLAGLGALTLADPSFRPARRWFWLAVPVVAALTVPWLVLARAGYAENTEWLSDATTLLPRLGQFAIECASVTSIVGTGLLFLLARRRRTPRASAGGRRSRPPLPQPHDQDGAERRLVAPLVAALMACALAIAASQSRTMIWLYGVRYTAAVIPFCAMLAGIAIARVSLNRWRPWVALVLVFGFTRFGQLTPWTFWERPTPNRDHEVPVTFHNPERVVDRLFRTTQAGYLRSLVEPNPGTTSHVIDFLNAHARPDDVVITNYSWEPLYFYTGLAQGMKVLPSYPIWGAAKDHQLPGYVFSPEGADWVVWRRAWGPYRGLACDRIMDTLVTSGAAVVQVASVPETLWENRENLHFRRFPGDRYYYSWFEDLPSTLIFRVDWPKTEPGSDQSSLRMASLGSRLEARCAG